MVQFFVQYSRLKAEHPKTESFHLDLERSVILQHLGMELKLIIRKPNMFGFQKLTVMLKNRTITYVCIFFQICQIISFCS